ncbi:hypothetical protein R3P38DRAFT_3168883 [Favolaschia claudopus]|uniref:Uncharacterized protein n=1 Tax=Favolaschia claudopus TaxID=2862362 RepID=A0AAW0E1I9_9AGAR
MPASAVERCVDEEHRRDRRLITYMRYRRRNLEETRRKTRERMAEARKVQSEEQRRKHREAQSRYRERFRETIAHRARLANEKKNSLKGRTTKRRPRARQYWSDPELQSSDEEEEEECDW